ncbi:MAG: SDR family NAD(P)-dependent oxidoreductase, partial [Dolichospermum sp.]
MDLGLTGKVALVTGSSAGIGLAVAQTLAQEGCKLIICGRNFEKIQQIEKLLSREKENLEILALSADVQKA